MAMRLNPLLDEMLRVVERQLLAERNIVLIRASRPLLDEWGDWSEPVQVRAVVDEDGTYELEARRP